MENRICVISVLYKNPKEQISKLEKSLKDNNIDKRDIYFIDNAKDNVGYGGAINKVVKKFLGSSRLRSNNKTLKYDCFFIVNPDIVLHKDCLKRLVQTLEENPEIGIVGPKILDTNGKIWSAGGILEKKRYSGGLIDYGNKNKKYKELFYDVDYVPGTAMLIKREVFEKIGLFSKDYFLYYEDDDFCLRAKKVGFRTVINPHAEVIHDASSSTGKNSPLMQYYMARNHLLFVERFAPLQVKIRELFRLPITIYEATPYERLGIRDYFLRRFGKHDYWR